MRSRMVPLLVAALALVIGSALFSADATKSDADAGPARPLVSAHDDTTTPFNLVDVPALIRHRDDGHALRRTRLVEETATTRRWAISYRGDRLRLTGTLAVPRSLGSHPVVVAMHGWIPTERYLRGATLVREEARLVAGGDAVLHPDYRIFAGSDRETGRMVPKIAPTGHRCNAKTRRPVTAGSRL